MQIQLGINKSPYNKMYKDFQVTQTLTGSLQEEFNEQEPSIQFSGNVYGVNYAIIEGKYYFIVGITHDLEGITTISFRLDILSTYKDYINGLDVYIERDSVGNPDIVDSQVMLSGKNKLIETWGDAIRTDEGVYVLTTSQEGWIQDVHD